MELLAVFLMAAGALLILWGILGLVLRPLTGGGTLQLVLRVRGEDLSLEHRVRGLLWLRVMFGALPEVVLWDDGMEEETRRIARRLADSCAAVRYWENGEQTDERTTDG